MRSAVQNSDQNSPAINRPRTIFCAIVLATALGLCSAIVVFAVLRIFIWDRIELTLRLQERLWIAIAPLILLYALIGITIADFFKTRGWSQRTWELAICVVLFNMYAIVWYWARQLWLALRGDAPNGIVFRFSFRTILIAFVIWSLVLAFLVNLYQAWPTIN